MSGLSAHSVDQVVTLATEIGIDVPDEILTLQTKLRAGAERPICGLTGNWAAEQWAASHPDMASWPDGMLGCCWGQVSGRGCDCWEPIYEVEQTTPQPVAGDPLNLPARARRCSDCAYRRDSPENADEWQAEGLASLAGQGQPFWCHDGMRRPIRWQHPAGPTIDASPDDWHPPRIGCVPYQADGTPALLCAGWGKARARLTQDGAA